MHQVTLFNQRTFTLMSEIQRMARSLRRTEQQEKRTLNARKFWLGVRIGLGTVLVPFFSYLGVFVILSLG